MVNKNWNDSAAKSNGYSAIATSHISSLSHNLLTKQNSSSNLISDSH